MTDERTNQGTAGQSDGEHVGCNAIVTRRFVLLGGQDCYYARGGFHDFLSSHDTLSEAVAKGKAGEAAKRYADQLEWWHVWDCQQNTVVACSKTQAYGAPNGPPVLDG